MAFLASYPLKIQLFNGNCANRPINNNERTAKVDILGSLGGQRYYV